MYEIIENGQVLLVKEVKTSTQTAIVKQQYTFVDKVMISTDKTRLTTGEVCFVTFKWQKFDTNDGIHKDNPVKSESITVKINSQEIELTPQNGQALLEFSADEPGTYEITTTALATDTIVVEVV